MFSCVSSKMIHTKRTFSFTFSKDVSKLYIIDTIINYKSNKEMEELTEKMRLIMIEMSKKIDKPFVLVTLEEDINGRSGMFVSSYHLNSEGVLAVLDGAKQQVENHPLSIPKFGEN